jgi:hypothetical protein
MMCPLRRSAAGLISLLLISGPELAEARGWFRRVFAPTTVSRGQNGDLRVVRRGPGGSVTSVSRFRPDGTVTHRERQLVRTPDGSTYQRTVSRTEKVRVRGAVRAGLERLKAVRDNPAVRWIGASMVGIGVLHSLGLSVPMATVVTSGSGYYLQDHGSDRIRRYFNPTARRVVQPPEPRSPAPRLVQTPEPDNPTPLAGAAPGPSRAATSAVASVIRPVAARMGRPLSFHNRYDGKIQVRTLSQPYDLALLRSAGLGLVRRGDRQFLIKRQGGSLREMAERAGISPRDIGKLDALPSQL